MKTMMLAAALLLSCSTGALVAQDNGMAGMDMKPQSGKPIPSPRKEAMADLAGTHIAISYGAPSLRGRKVLGGQDPYGKEWRLGANEATSFKTTGDVTIAGAKVPAGSYTLFAVPSEDKWTLIISKKTGEWGIPYPGADSDFARVPMMKSPLAAPQEQMLIVFEKTAGGKTQMHVKWDHFDEWVPVTKG